ncbi:hypothetical protein L6164_021164 [Bauhinia variegata]|uniref:Uncharacterized protein n=1 Tax=Bauhinia variegata TaxID=167791 RepID=A0ACB9MZC3_BAUVA|nr:hypothetical protein L6164_021164 [Bauhinia variegata]
MVMEDDWDLHAVVRGCATITTTTCSPSSSTVTTATNTTSCSVSSSGFGAFYQPAAAASYGFPVFGSEHGGQVLTLSDPFEERSSIEELHELYKPFFPKSHAPSLQATPHSPLSSFSVSSAPKASQMQQKHQQPGKQSHAGSATTQRSKRRKNQLKKVCQVPAEALSSDIWAWRKYGQKPIKGSPYPRGYYRCSSSKGCLARKQVERNRSDPTMFIVTYTGEHNHPAPTHRNSLAGSTRQKPLTTQVATAGDSENPPTKPISPASSGVEEEVAVQSAKSDSKEEKEDLVDDEEGEFGISDMLLADDFFEGLDELTRSSPPQPPVAGDCFIDTFSAGITLPVWVANNAAAAAGGS